MSETEKKEEEKPTVFMCGVECKAGGPKNDGGHKFTVPREGPMDGGGYASWYECELCGKDNISFSMWNGP